MLAAGCDGGVDKPAASASAAAHKPDLTGADKRLTRIYSQANLLLPGGYRAYLDRIDSLRGLPIVVNKWASWCGPCRNEFPLFQDAAKQFGGEIAFLGVNMNDPQKGARSFLNTRPVPYPSYVDDKLEISKLLPPLQGAPTTGFYSPRGNLLHVKIGEYRNAAALRADIEEWVRPD